MRSLRSIQHDQDGVTAIEFAIIAPVFLLFILGIIEFGIIMMVYNVMEGATAISSRLGKTGYAESGKTREQTILDAVAARGGSLIDADKLILTSKFYKQYDQINDPEPYIDANHNGQYNTGESYTDVNGNGHWDADMGSSGYGSSGDVVVYTISYPWSVTTPILQNLIGTHGIYTITTHAVVKNEPY